MARMFASLDCEYLRLETLSHFHYFLKWIDERILENGLLHILGGQVQPIKWGQMNLSFFFCSCCHHSNLKSHYRAPGISLEHFIFLLDSTQFLRIHLNAFFQGFNSAFRDNQINICLNAFILSTTTKLFWAHTLCQLLFFMLGLH